MSSNILGSRRNHQYRFRSHQKYSKAVRTMNNYLQPIDFYTHTYSRETTLTHLLSCCCSLFGLCIFFYSLDNRHNHQCKSHNLLFHLWSMGTVCNQFRTIRCGNRTCIPHVNSPTHLPHGPCNFLPTCSSSDNLDSLRSRAYNGYNHR